MTTILIVAHAPLATALQAVAQHAYPDCAKQVSALDVASGAGAEQVEADLRGRLAALPPGEVLVLTDVFGATPCNAAMKVADGVRVCLVAGVNVPMLWRCLCYGDRPLADLVERAVDGARNGAMHVPLARRQNQAAPAVAHDQVQHHHQQ